MASFPAVELQLDTSPERGVVHVPEDYVEFTLSRGTKRLLTFRVLNSESS
jgi:hypothetical protein